MRAKVQQKKKRLGSNGFCVRIHACESHVVLQSVGNLFCADDVKCFKLIIKKMSRELGIAIYWVNIIEVVSIIE